MSGRGQRFRDAGYKVDKPFIKVHSKPIIEHLSTKVFNGSESVYFICREDHLRDNFYFKELKRISSKDKIIPIPSHKKGPVHTYLEAYQRLPSLDNLLISYCDYYMHWDFNHYSQFIKETCPSGNIPCYTGFHPHLLPTKNLYASCKVTDRNELVEIKEKFSFEKDKTKAFHSPGVYYFANSELCYEYFKKSVQKNLILNNEFYVSLVYNLLVNDKLKVNIYDQVSHFCQWGTPEDLEEYKFWTEHAKDYKETQCK